MTGYDTISPSSRSRRRRRRHAVAAIACVAAALTLPCSSAAQDSRAATIAAAQAEKAGQLAPPEPTGAEAVLQRVSALLTLPPKGFSPVSDSLNRGGGFPPGPGYRRYVSDRSVIH